jgi:protein TonB
MPEQLYWRRAVAASCLIHCFILLGAGWLSGGLFSQAAGPEIIEMELISNAALTEPAAAVPVAIPQATPSQAQPVQAYPVPKPRVSTADRDDVADSYSPLTASPEPAAGPGDNAVPAAAAVGTGPAAPAGAKRISAPRILHKVEPEYPENARQDGFSGTVGVKIEVLENGRPGDVQLARSSGRRSLDDAALQAVRKWRFVPAQETASGQPVRCFTTLSVVFRLN